MRTLSHARGALLAALLLVTLAAPASAQQVSFRMNPELLRMMADGDDIQPTIGVHVTDHGPLHTLANDCEMHVAGTVTGMQLGTPPAMVVEFPNWCRFRPDGQQSSNFNALSATWRNFVRDNMIDRDCQVKGFLRIFCEHCTGGGSGGSNPNHAYELHPATSIRCEGGQAFDNGTEMLRSFPGLRHISPSTAALCIAQRRLRVRFRQGQYEFAESGGGTCGNFAIVRVSRIDLQWSIELEGGTYTFATVTADGHRTDQMGLYTLAGTPIDGWLRQRINAGGVGSTPKVIHGVLTYDWEAIVDTLSDQQGNLRRPSQWENVRFPIALIAYGETTAPF